MGCRSSKVVDVSTAKPKTGAQKQSHGQTFVIDYDTTPPTKALDIEDITLEPPGDLVASNWCKGQVTLLTSQRKKPEPIEMDFSRVCKDFIDTVGSHIIEARAMSGHNLSALRAPGDASWDERAEAERSLVAIFQELTEEFGGEYFPLEGSSTYSMRPGGMDPSEAEELRKADLLFTAPVCSPAEMWPEARGVFTSDSRRFVAWVNESEHVRLIALERSSDLQALLQRLSQAESVVRSALRQSCQDLILVSPPCIEITAKVPRAAARPGFQALCRQLKLRVGVKFTRDGAVDVDMMCFSTADEQVVGEQANSFITGLRKLIELEVRLEKGEDVKLPQAL